MIYGIHSWDNDPRACRASKMPYVACPQSFQLLELWGGHLHTRAGCFADVFVKILTDLHSGLTKRCWWVPNSLLVVYFHYFLSCLFSQGSQSWLDRFSLSFISWISESQLLWTSWTISKSWVLWILPNTPNFSRFLVLPGADYNVKAVLWLL